MTYFLDTSALVKIYHSERGNEQVRGIYKADAVLQVSELSRVEFVSATMRKLREGVINRGVSDALLGLFTRDLLARYDVLSFSSLVIDEAIRIFELVGGELPIRSLDAIQVAFYNLNCEADTRFLCSDTRLIAVLENQRIPVINPAV